MPYSILHISDLHRAASDPIGNDELLSTLTADVERYSHEDPQLRDPDAIVVSGDLIQGVTLGTSEYPARLQEQYATAVEFLERLTDAFLEGDRARLVVVPGNHDVDWNTARSAMEPVPDSDIPSDFSPALCVPSSDWRWNWTERRAYRIVNRPLYEQRLDQFDRAVASFYADVGIVQREHFRIHTHHERRIAIVAFNSCVGNDCFAFHGAIEQDAVAQAHLELRDWSEADLRVAVWHHGIEGAPALSDYMDASTVYALIGKGFRLGLHGHQHRAAMTTRYVHLPEEQRMAVVSAGSLCAGRLALPQGVNRQFNVIEIEDNLAKARVHVREMAIATVFAPARRAEFGGRSYVDVEWELPRSPGRRIRQRATVLDAERAIAEGRFDDAVRLSCEMDRASPYGRALLLRALRESGNWARLIEEFGHPETLDELVAAATARAELGDAKEAITFLEAHNERLDLPKPTLRELRNALTVKGKLR
jgi:calcineurin-like phosphoesterase family protein